MTKVRPVLLACLIAAMLLGMAGCKAPTPAQPTQAPSQEAEGTREPEATLEPFQTPNAGTEADSSDSVLFEWDGVPVMPGAIRGKQFMEDYMFTTPASMEEISAYYKQHMPELGWTVRDDLSVAGENITLAFKNATKVAFVNIWTEGENRVVKIHVLPVHGTL